jgi:hypothetical protein
MEPTNELNDFLYTFCLSYTAEDMKDLPDLMHVHDGVDIRVNLGNIMGGWCLEDSPQSIVVAVWFLKMTDGTWQRLAA